MIWKNILFLDGSRIVPLSCNVTMPPSGIDCRSAVRELSVHPKPFVIRRFGTEIDAQVAKAYLDSKGIDSIIEKDDVGGLNPNFQMTSGVSLIVRQRDEKKAVKLLDSVRG